MKKTYIAPATNAIDLHMDTDLLGVSTHDEVSDKPQLSDEKDWNSDFWENED